MKNSWGDCSAKTVLIVCCAIWWRTTYIRTYYTWQVHLLSHIENSCSFLVRVWYNVSSEFRRLTLIQNGKIQSKIQNHYKRRRNFIHNRYYFENAQNDIMYVNLQDCKEDLEHFQNHFWMKIPFLHQCPKRCISKMRLHLTWDLWHPE